MGKLIPAEHDILISYLPNDQVDNADIIDWKNPLGFTIDATGKFLQWNDDDRQEVIARFEAVPHDRHDLRRVLEALLALEDCKDAEETFLAAARTLHKALIHAERDIAPLRELLTTMILRSFKAGAELEA